MQFSRYIKMRANRKQLYVTSLLVKVQMLFDALACNAMSDKTVGFRASHPDRLSSVITYTNLFVYLITGETSYHNSTALLTGLAVISCCSSVPVSMPKDFVRSFRTLVDWYFRILGEVFSNLSFLKFPSDLVFFFLNLAATYSPTPSPVQYHRPFRSLPSCSGWERVLPLNASPPKSYRS